MDISVLINNVGVAGAGPFTEHPDHIVHNIITANMYSVVLLSQQVIKSFKKRFAERGARSLICNTSAMAALAPAPNCSIYAASKIAGDYIGFGLTSELKEYKVDVCMWRAAGVHTKIIGDGHEPNCVTATPELYVEKAFSKCTSGLHCGFFPHEVMHLINTNLKDLFGYWITKRLFSKLFEYGKEGVNKNNERS